MDPKNCNTKIQIDLISLESKLEKHDKEISDLNDQKDRLPAIHPLRQHLDRLIRNEVNERRLTDGQIRSLKLEIEDKTEQLIRNREAYQRNAAPTQNLITTSNDPQAQHALLTAMENDAKAAKENELAIDAEAAKIDARKIEEVDVRTMNRMNKRIAEQDFAGAHQLVDVKADLKRAENGMRAGFQLENNSPICVHRPQVPTSSPRTKRQRVLMPDVGRCRYPPCAFHGNSSNERNYHERRIHERK